MIPYGRQSISSSDVEAVTAALQSGWLTTGPRVAEFEEAFAERVGGRFAVAVSSGTAALHLSLLAANIGDGDRVVTSPNTFLASANCAAYVGATPDFVDIDDVSYTLCPDALEKTWQRDTKAVVAVDYAGQTADMPRIAEIAHGNQAIVIEDACHATGGRFEHDGKTYSIGGHPWADITVFSFHPVKTMTAGEGGMLVTDDEEIAHRARLLRNHGMRRDSFVWFEIDGNEAEQGPWYYEMRELGFNYRITDIQCALAMSQLSRLGDFIKRRQEIVREYNDAFRSLDFIEIPKLRNASDENLVSWHLYTVLLSLKVLSKTRTQVIQELKQKRIGSQVLYIPVHLQPWYRERFGYRSGKCPIAEDYYLKTLSLPLFPEMSADEVGLVVAAIRQLGERNK